MLFRSILMADFIQKLFSTRHNYPNGDTRIGEKDRIWYDSVRNAFYISDGETEGGILIGGGGGGGGTYTLPTASTTTKGGVKVDGVTITITNGVITAQASLLQGPKVTKATREARAHKVSRETRVTQVPRVLV